MGLNRNRTDPVAHFALDDALPLLAAHQIALDVEARIRDMHPDSDITIHQDPVSLGEERLPS